MKLLPLLSICLILAPALWAAENEPLGYQDTPIIPGTKWHVHDGERLQPPVVTPGKPSTQEQVGTAPSDAIVLFDGKDLSQFKTVSKKGETTDAAWKVENGYMEANKSGDLYTKEEYGPDLQLHVEWASPNPPNGTGQHRGNSGLFFYGRYECQVLDNYQNQTYPDGQATGIYGYMPPRVNASLPPGQWQQYDIIFQGPRFKDQKLAVPAYITVFHNGVATQIHTALIGETPHKKVGTYTAHPEKGSFKIQDHGDPVRYRFIWLRELHLPGPDEIGEGPQIGK